MGSLLIAQGTLPRLTVATRAGGVGALLRGMYLAGGFQSFLLRNLGQRRLDGGSVVGARQSDGLPAKCAPGSPKLASISTPAPGQQRRGGVAQKFQNPVANDDPTPARSHTSFVATMPPVQAGQRQAGPWLATLPTIRFRGDTVSRAAVTGYKMTAPATASAVSCAQS